eukprot:649523-Prorocentrum_minimum.AAC.1
MRCGTNAHGYFVGVSVRDERARPLSSVDASFPEHYIFTSQVEGWAGRGGGSIMKLKSLGIPNF